MPRRLIITDQASGLAVCTGAVLADTFRTRLFGLLGRKSLAPGAGLLIKPSSGVHTFGMSFPIDIVALDHRNTVVSVSEQVGPRAIRGLTFRTRSVLELPAGRIRECGIAPGHTLTVQPAP